MADFTIPHYVDMSSKILGISPDENYLVGTDGDIAVGKGKTVTEPLTDKGKAEKKLYIADVAHSSDAEIGHKLRNLAIDFTPVILGAILGGGSGAIAGSSSIDRDVAKAMKQLGNGLDDSLGHAAKFHENITNSKINAKVKRLGEQNAKIAADVSNGKMQIEKGSEKIWKNTKKGIQENQLWKPSKFDNGKGKTNSDIVNIIKENPGMTKAETKSVEKQWLKNGDTSNLKLVEAHDPKYTYEHSIRVPELAKKLAKADGLPESEIAKLDNASLHDIGKVSTPTMPLDSSVVFSKLPEEQNQYLRGLMDNHTEPGYKILKDNNNIAAEFAKKHHPKTLEDFNKLSETEQALVVADILDAIRGERSYKNSKTMDTVIKIFMGNPVVSQQWKDIVEKMFKDGELEEYYIPELNRLSPSLRNSDTSPLANVYRQAKYDAIKNKVKKDYKKKDIPIFLDDIKKGAANGALDGLVIESPTFGDGIPSLSEMLEIMFPSWRMIKDKVTDIKQWFDSDSFGDNSEEAYKLIMNTDFNDNGSVTETWKKLKKMLKNKI